jgi:hypothetical protein
MENNYEGAVEIYSGTNPSGEMIKVLHWHRGSVAPVTVHYESPRALSDSHQSRVLAWSLALRLRH